MLQKGKFQIKCTASEQLKATMSASEVRQKLQENEELENTKELRSPKSLVGIFNDLLEKSEKVLHLNISK